jgi:tetratricopeptide (TPR) repeat protein
MINDLVPGDKSEPIIEPTPLKVVFVESQADELAAFIPPLEDIAEIARLKDAHFSIGDVVHRDRGSVESAFRFEMGDLLKKERQFAHSSIFQNRLANLAQLSGNRELEQHFLKRAIEVDNNDFFNDRLGENLISREKFDDAEKIFLARDLERDVHANLRLAFLHVRKSDFVSASSVIDRALAIEPFDYGSRLFEGSLRLVSGDAESAIRSFRIAEESRPNSSVLHTNLSIAYASLSNYERALVSAKKAAALDPLNKNAVSLLADLAFRQRCNEDAIPALRYYVSFEQKHAHIWAQLARSLIEIGSYDEAISALRRQGSITDSVEVWNNLGVAYHRKGKASTQKALEAFAFATSEKWTENRRVSAVALRNLCSVLFNQNEHRRVLQFTSAVVANSELFGLALKDADVSDLYIFRIVSLMNEGRTRDASELCESLLAIPDTTISLRTWLASWLIAYYSLRQNPRALKLSHEFVGLFWEREAKKDRRNDMLVNNIAFACAEFGDLAQAEHFVQMVANRVHVDPYPTATLGLLHLRRGHEERGEALYEEAVRLAHSQGDKSRIRQKMHLELARLKLAQPAVARRHLDKAIALRGGAPELAEQAREMRASLTGLTN